MMRQEEFPKGPREVRNLISENRKYTVSEVLDILKRHDGVLEQTPVYDLLGVDGTEVLSKHRAEGSVFGKDPVRLFLLKRDKMGGEYEYDVFIQGVGQKTIKYFESKFGAITKMRLFPSK